MTKINVSLGVTLCTDEGKRNFMRFGLEAQDIDVDGDVEVQAQAALTAAMTVAKVLNDGITETITEVICEANAPGLVRDALASHDEKIMRMGRILRKAVGDIENLKGDTTDPSGEAKSG